MKGSTKFWLIIAAIVVWLFVSRFIIANWNYVNEDGSHVTKVLTIGTLVILTIGFILFDICEDDSVIIKLFKKLNAFLDKVLKS